MPTLLSLAPEHRARATACLQMVALLLALVAGEAFLSGVAGDTPARRTPIAEDAQPARRAAFTLSEAAALPRPATMSAALLPEPGAWMMTTLGLLGLEWMARRQRSA